MSSVLKERLSNKESGPFENRSTDMSNLSGQSGLSGDSQESNKEEDLQERSPNENKWLLIVAVHFCNVMYSACFWINVGVYPVWQIDLFIL